MAAFSFLFLKTTKQFLVLYETERLTILLFLFYVTLSPQVSVVSKRIHVCLAHVPTVVTAILCPTANSLVPVLLVTMAPIVSMTQMSVPPPHLCARTKACVWTSQVHIDATANLALPAPTVRMFTYLAFHLPASMVEPVDRWRTRLMYATVCQVSSARKCIAILIIAKKKKRITKFEQKLKLFKWNWNRLLRHTTARQIVLIPTWSWARQINVW